MNRIIFFVFVIGFYLLIDLYSYSGMRQLFADARGFKIIYWVLSLFTIIAFFKVYVDLVDHQGIRQVSTNLLLGFVFTIFVTKFLFSIMMLVQDSGRILVGTGQYFYRLFGENTYDAQFLPSRRRAITGLFTGIVAIPFISLIYAFTKGKYQYEVKKMTLTFPDLPKAFDGFKLVQISDIHSGSYDSYEQVLDGIKLVNNLNPDAIVFTGDLVNSNKDEIDPFISAFQQLSAPEGKFSITGNHDYYGLPKDAKQRAEYWQDFQSKHSQMGFTLLNNESISLQREGDSIRIIGIENWGTGGFPKIGDLAKAMSNVNHDEFKVLLSHDPTHWEQQVMNENRNIHLTLSGHTHGMQFGIAALGLKWSPIKYRYKRWMGLYEENKQRLYVNRGFGFLGFPGRVGMWPEITEFTFKRAEA